MLRLIHPGPFPTEGAAFFRRPAMSVESAVAYIKRMREDAAFRQIMNDLSEDENASWAHIRTSGFDFTMQEFKKAQDEIYKEHGITPM